MATYGGAPPIVTDGLVFAVDAANKKSYPGSGTTWKDLSGNSNNGTLINGPTFDSGNGGSIVLDGTDDRVDVSNISTSDFNGEATLLCWLVCGSNSPESARTGIFGFGSSVHRSHYVWTNGKAYFDTFRNNRVENFDLSSLDRTTPHLLAITTKSGGNWNLYQNTTVVKTVAAESTIVWDNPSIGADGSTEAFRFDGKFFTFSLYNRELSAAEILQNYNALKSRFGL